MLEIEGNSLFDEILKMIFPSIDVQKPRADPKTKPHCSTGGEVEDSKCNMFQISNRNDKNQPTRVYPEIMWNPEINER